jgi:hypothetical protein
VAVVPAHHPQSENIRERPFIRDPWGNFLKTLGAFPKVRAGFWTVSDGTRHLGWGNAETTRAAARAAEEAYTA